VKRTRFMDVTQAVQCRAVHVVGVGKLFTPSICYLFLHSTRVHSTLGVKEEGPGSLSFFLSSLKIVQRQNTSEGD